MKRSLSLISLFGFFLSPAFGDVSLPPIFSDHMVLQKIEKAPIWGTAAPGESVAVTLNDLKRKVNADSNGKWRVDLDLRQQSAGPFTMTVQGKNLVTINDVMIGEVWVCGGQSNMEMEVKHTIDADKEVAASANPQIRLFQVKRKCSITPVDEVQGEWSVAGPATTGSFTAVGYYFAKAVQSSIKSPVGLISSNYGGTPIEPWMGYEAISQDPDLKPTADEVIDAARKYPQALKDFRDRYKAWQDQNKRPDIPTKQVYSYATVSDAVTGWAPVKLPGKFADQGFADSGIFWVRGTVEVPDSAVGKYLPIRIGGVHGFIEVYWDGKKFGSTAPFSAPGFNDGLRSSNTLRFDVPFPWVKAGKATLAIRVYSPGGNAGIDNAVSGANHAVMPTDWQIKVEKAFPPLDSTAKAAYPETPATPGAERATPTELYNGMIHPLIPYAIRGVLWYQGESNTQRAAQYKTELPLLVKQWRSDWGEGDFPFYFCQLANMNGKWGAPTESPWAEIREGITAALSLPNTGQAVLIDIGEQDDVHYRNKKEAGNRLAYVALAKTYGQKIPFSGPMYDSFTVEGNAIRIRFKPGDGGLVAKPLPATYQPKSSAPATLPLKRNSPGSQLEGFTICGNDHKWYWADASIDGDSVVVSSKQAPNPVAVRYAWADNPTCNLYNGAGLPACPFRTDTFPLSTEGRKY